MDIQTLSLRSRDLARQQAFYAGTLGLDTERTGESRLHVHVGTTLLEFVHDPQFAGFYHFAFTVPENQIAEAREWLGRRVTLLTDGQNQELFHSPQFNTHNVYFDDADGNIAELIARHDLPNASTEVFGAGSLLHVSEIGLVVPDVAQYVQHLSTRHGLQPYKGESDTFTAVGTSEGMFITVPEARGWFPVNRPAPCAPFELVARTPRGTFRYTHHCPAQEVSP
ncbi:VOC family protein [Deinococcus peraridilitoris]|uniref:Putative ring-cleavage extradiol dioxygenase n=1 Tax=Deinococcus peraridilitoris (strain DSM 19664 / LMG 22246 / CIP 109416 / KR-200) TaxID=937777 RepID=K9ZZT0_DEIPD|nr:ring-cleavage extradiol dioxygenase [Deinococcus peraridilitoris]AFZ66452.1 putative ring-cleavage extradiol dioxygenase [Deinococcus peraridilitoris DSM 19664]